MSGDGPASGAREGPIVTLDGPAGSGKSSTAREVARRVGFRHLDSGALYRALTWALLERGEDPAGWHHLGEDDFAALDLRADPVEDGFRITVAGRPVGAEIREPRVTSRVSRLASLPAVRECLLGLQRSAGRVGRLVADGRDMGTVVFPDADVKVFLVADVRERARRRLLELGRREPTDAEIEDQMAEIAERDRRDSERIHSPLRKPEDAFELDTTARSFEEQVEAVVARIRAVTR